MFTRFAALRIFVAFFFLLALLLFVSTPVAIAVGTTTPLLTPQQFDKLSPAEKQEYIKLIQIQENPPLLPTPTIPTPQELKKLPPQKIPPPPAPSASSTPQRPNVQLIADTNLQDCAYTHATSTARGFLISCSIINKLGNQGDIHYGVQLIKRTTAQEVVDTKVYDEVLSLRMNQTVKRQMEYTPPNYLSGTYELWGLLKTSSGLPLSSNFLGAVILKATAVSYLEIKSSTCALRVQGEAATTTYTSMQWVDVNPDEVVEGTCVVAAHAMENITVTPSFITYQGSVFGETVPVANDIQKSFTFKNNETKTISFVVPKASAPQSYIATLSLVSPKGVAVSNEVDISYVVRGAGATIQNVLLDKDYYAAGERAQVSVFWTGSAFGPRQLPADTEAKSIVISIKDSSNTSCANEATFTISADVIERNRLTPYLIRITRLCINPHITIEIIDAAGVSLAEKTITLASGEIPEGVVQANILKQRVAWYGAVALAVLIIVGTILYIRKRNSVHEIS